MFTFVDGYCFGFWCDGGWLLSMPVWARTHFIFKNTWAHLRHVLLTVVQRSKSSASILPQKSYLTIIILYSSHTTYTHTHTHIRARAHAGTHPHTHIHTQARAHARAHAHKHTYARTQAHARTHGRTHTRTRAHAHTHTHTPMGCREGGLQQICL